MHWSWCRKRCWRKRAPSRQNYSRRRKPKSPIATANAEIASRSGASEVPATSRRLPLFDLAARAAEMAARGEIAESLDTKGTAETPLTFPNGCHIAEVEIDPDTGITRIVNYTCVDDCGNVLDHTI